MKPVNVYNFCGTSEVAVDATVHPSCGPLINLIQAAGGLRFQHSMSTGQARQMAAALIAGAEEMEALNVSNEVPA